MKLKLKQFALYNLKVTSVYQHHLYALLSYHHLLFMLSLQTSISVLVSDNYISVLLRLLFGCCWLLLYTLMSCFFSQN